MLRSHSGVVAAAVLVAALCGAPALAAPPSAAPAAEDQAKGADTEVARVTDHQIVIGGRTSRYKATAGTLVIRDDAGKPTASVFYLGYVAERAKDAPERPVTFLFNGGPGSASLWLNIGGFGPVRGVTSGTKPTGPAPYQFGPNPESLLDKSDLVFIDAIGTGYSRPIAPSTGKDFWGVDQDVDAFARAITRYIDLNDRWNSPKFLFGESYGTTRAAALVYKLANQDIDFNGVVLMSTILNFASDAPGLDQHYIDTLPTFAAAAWSHGKVADAPSDLSAFLQEVRAYAQGPYAAALARGDTISPAEADAVARQLNRYLGLPVDYLKHTNLRLDMEQFRKELLKDQGLTIGRFDSRFSGPATDEHSDPARDDPATAGVSSAYLTTFRSHVARDLGYRTELEYRALYNMVIEPQWDWRHRAPGIGEPLTTPNVALDLAAAMRANPNLKVFAVNGLFDMATPFFATERDLSHMFVPPEIRRNLQFGYYRTGHMAYTDHDALVRIKADLAAFYDAAAPR